MQSLTRLLLLPLLAAPAFAQSAAQPITGLAEQDAVVDAIFAIPDEDLQVMAILDELSNGIGPRLTSSTNLTEACHWAVQRFEDYGLENVRLVEWGTYPVGFDRTYKRGRMVQPKKMELDFTTNAWTPGTRGAQRGRALVAPANEEELESVRALLPGSWLLCASGGATPRYGTTDEFRDRLGRACDEAGILGVIMPVRGELVRTDGRVPADMDSVPTRVFISLRRDQFAELQASANAGNAVELEFDINQSFVPGPIPLYNVIAEIPGTDKAEEMVIFGGHIDSWDGARGAQDNGTGTSTTLEAARILAATLREQGLKPRRTIRFMLWSGEEQGLLGSAAYVEQHPEELPYISAVIVHDGGTNACAGIEATPSMAPMFEEVFGPMIAHTADAEDEDLRFRIAPVAQLTYPIGSDHDSYIPYGVPGFFWQQFGRTSYGYIHHTQHDFYEEAAPDYQRFTARIVASTAWRLANAETMVPRDDMRKASPPRRRMGIALGDDGVSVVTVTDGGIAAKAGMKPGDKIVQIDDKTIDGQTALREALNGGENRKYVVWQRGDEKFAAWFDWEKNAAEAAPTAR